MGIKAFDKRFRAPIYAIYGFVRFADEIVDISEAPEIFPNQLGEMENDSERKKVRSSCTQRRQGEAGRFQMESGEKMKYRS